MRYSQLDLQSTLIQLLGTSQQGHETLLHFHAQVNVKRNVTRSREGRRKPKACLLNVTHQLRLSTSATESGHWDTRQPRHHSPRWWLECPCRVWREHFLLLPLLPHRFAHGIKPPCHLASPAFPNLPLLHPPSFSSSTTKDDMTHSGQAPWQKCFRSERLQMWTHTSYWILSCGSMPGSGI